MMSLIRKALATVRSTYPWIPVLPAFVAPPIYFIFFHHPTLAWSLGSAVAFFAFDGLGIQIGIHKLLCHRSFRTTDRTRRALAFLSVLSGQGSPLFWVVVHMGSHHPYADLEKDVHSPTHGLFNSFIGWYWNIDVTKLSFVPARRYLADKYLLFLHKYHYFIFLGYWLMLGVFGFKPLVYLGFLPVALSIALVGLVNAFLHSNGPLSKLIFLKYRNFDAEPSFNSVILGPLTMGLGYHNNHHQAQNEKYSDVRWFEFDPSRLVVPLIETRTPKLS